MATYNEFKGDTIEVRATDPANPVEGEIWYNSTSGVIKGYQTVAAAWASGGNINTSRRGMGGAGTQTAGLVAGGISTANTGDTEEYNGSSWSEQNNLSTSRQGLAGCGLQTASLVFGGYTAPPT